MATGYTALPVHRRSCDMVTTAARKLEQVTHVRLIIPEWGGSDAGIGGGISLAGRCGASALVIDAAEMAGISVPNAGM